MRSTAYYILNNEKDELDKATTGFSLVTTTVSQLEEGNGVKYQVLKDDVINQYEMQPFWSTGVSATGLTDKPNWS